MKFLVTIISLVLITVNIQAQDLHFSQSDLNTAMRNPAAMGQSEATYQLMASYRSQWATIPAAYRNIALAFEQKINQISIGGSILHNDAGKASLRNTQILLDFAYRKKLSKAGEYLSFGASGGIIQQRFQSDLFEFDRQYEGGVGFDKSLSNGENLLKESQILPSITVGVFVNKYINRINVSGGISFAHLNKPVVQFYEGSTATYPMRTSAFAKIQVPFRSNMKGEIHGLMNHQLVANEKIIGGRLLYQLNDVNWLTAGIASRLGDALILEGGLKFSNSSFTISYDMNHSALRPVSNSKGAIELSMTYSFNKREKEIIPTISVQEKELDSDGDGIVDNLDECPNFPGLRQFNGCNDTDQDGIWDSQDACPHLYGTKTNRGCPGSSVDTDKDGLMDEVDNCPFMKGAAAMGGCPDSDKDGLSDLDDYCPFLKGEKDNNGCPKMNKEAHQSFLKNRSVSAIVEFDTDKSEIENYFDDELNEVVIFMLENKEATAFITGHTDNEGDAAYNFALGERRAMEVMDYLIQRGIAVKNLSTISYGETKPVRGNRNSSEKARNRRVEVKVYLN